MADIRNFLFRQVSNLDTTKVSKSVDKEGYSITPNLFERRRFHITKKHSQFSINK